MKTVDEYIAQAPADVRGVLEKIRKIIHKAAPDAVEGISYGMPGYKLGGKPLVYFAYWKEHIGLYATPSGHAAFAKELTKYKGAKGSVRFLLDESMPYELIKRMVEYRVSEVSG